MYKRIKLLKHLTGKNTDRDFAEFLGFTENTVTRAKAGHYTKMNKFLLMLEWIFDQFTTEQRERFAEEFSREEDVKKSLKNCI